MWRAPVLAAFLAAALGTALETQDDSVIARQREGVRAVLQRKGGGGRLTPDMQQIVTTLNEVVEGIEAERTKAKQFTDTLHSECEESLVPVRAAVARRSGIIGGLEQDLEDLNTEAKGLESTLNGLTDDIQKANDKITDLEGRLTTLREGEAKNAELFEVGVREVDEVISKASLLAKRKPSLKAASQERGPYSEQVNNLQQLGRQLAFSSPSASGAGADMGGLPAFVQMASVSASEGPVLRGPGAVLMADKADVMRAQNNTQNAFEMEERRLLDLVDIERKRLAVLQASQGDQQPILTEKLKQASETNSLFEMATRNLGRDKMLVNQTEAWCRIILEGHELLDPLRHEIANLVKMPIKMLESMDMASFLSRDLQHLSAAPALVQVHEARRRSHKSQSLTAEMAVATSDPGSQDSVAAAQDNSAAQETADNLPQLPAASALQESASSEGPFDKVSEMLQALISALREEANDDAAGENMRKWCVGAVKVNKKAKVMTQSTIDMLKTEAKWTQTAIDRLNDLVSFLGDEVPRLRAAEQQINGMTKKMDDQMQAETKDRLLTKDVVQRSIVVLIELCELDDSQLMLLANKSSAPVRRGAAPAFFQTELSSNLLTGKGSQCAEAAKMLKEAVSKIVSVNSEHATFLQTFKAKHDDVHGVVALSIEERSADLTRCKAAAASRASDLAVSQEDLRHKGNDLKLLSDEIRELEQSCGPRAETHEERTARRQDEIDALKNALSVLEGESIPVDYSLLQTGQQTRHLRRR